MTKWRFKRGYGSHVELDTYTRRSDTSGNAVLFLLAASIMSLVISAAFGVDLTNVNQQYQEETHVHN